MNTFAPPRATTVRSVFDDPGAHARAISQLHAGVALFERLAHHGNDLGSQAVGVQVFDEDAGALAAAAGEAARNAWWVLQHALRDGLLAHTLRVAFGGDASNLDDASWAVLRAELANCLRSGGAIPVTRAVDGSGEWELAWRTAPPTGRRASAEDLAYWATSAGESRRLEFRALAFPMSQRGALAPRYRASDDDAQSDGEDEVKGVWRLEPAKGWAHAHAERTLHTLCPLLGGLTPGPVWVIQRDRVRAQPRATLASLASVPPHLIGVGVRGALGAWCVWELPAPRTRDDGWPYVCALYVASAVRDDIERRPRDPHAGLAGEAWALSNDPHLASGWATLRRRFSTEELRGVRHALIDLVDHTSGLAPVVEDDIESTEWAAGSEHSRVIGTSGELPYRPLLAHLSGGEASAARLAFLRERALGDTQTQLQALLRIGAALSDAYKTCDIHAIQVQLRLLPPCWFRMLAPILDTSRRMVSASAPVRNLPTYAGGWADRAHGLLPLTLLLARLGCGRASHNGLSRAVLATIRATRRYHDDASDISAHAREAGTLIQTAPPNLQLPSCRSMWSNGWCVWSQPAPPPPSTTTAPPPSSPSSSSSSSSSSSGASGEAGDSARDAPPVVDIEDLTRAMESTATTYGRGMRMPSPPADFAAAHAEDPVLMARVRCSMLCDRCTINTNRRDARDPSVHGVPISSPMQFILARRDAH